MPKYTSDEIRVLRSDIYFELFEKRGVKFLRIRKSKSFENLFGLKLELAEENHVWSSGDNLRRLAFNFYGDGDLWWVLGLVNQKPTDGHWKIGDEMLVPLSPYALSEAL